MNADDQAEFAKAYTASYRPAREILEECYAEVASGNEIRSVNMAVDRHDQFPMGRIDGTRTWRVGETVRAQRDPVAPQFVMNSFTAGVYVAMMMAQIDLLIAQGHCYSEVETTDGDGDGEEDRKNK
jgi:ketol-acid reductoisomerase